MHYQGQVEATTRLIKQLKDEKQIAKDKLKMGIGQIRDIVLTWKNRTKRLVEESSVQWWSKWAKHTSEVQVLRADVENRRKDDDDFYKMDEECIVTIQEELSDDFLSLAAEQFAAVRWLVEQLNDDQLGTQLQLERYERECKRQVATKMTSTINIGDREQSPEKPRNVARIGGGQPDDAQAEQREVVNSKEPVEVGRHQQEEPRTKEPEPEAPRPIEPGKDRTGEEQAGNQQQQP